MSKIELYGLDDMREIVNERDSRLAFTGEVFVDHKRNGEFLCKDMYMGKNIIPTEGLNHILDSVLHGATQVNPWYIGIYKNNYTPLATNTAANALGVAGLFGECQDADYGTPATNRPEYVEAAASGGVITNSASKAEFTMAASITVYGAFLASSQAKTATSGTLLAAKKFDTSRTVVSGDILYVTYQITAVSS